MRKTQPHQTRPKWLTCTLYLLCIGCAGSLDNPDAFTGGTTGSGSGSGSGSGMDAGMQMGNCELSDIFQELVVPGCAGAGCHDSTSAAGSLDLSSESGLGALVDTAAVACPDDLLFDSASPENSQMLERLKTSPSCGPLTMPPPPTAVFTTEEVECMEEWVNAVISQESP